MAEAATRTNGSAGDAATAPDRAPLVLLALILVAAVANLNLAVANVALPSIGAAFDASQTTLDLVAVGYSLGLAASVLYLGALGDRYGRKLMLVLGVALSVPACLLAAYAPTTASSSWRASWAASRPGMAYPTTLALITALWSGPGPNPLDRAVVGHRRRHLRARPARGGSAAGALLVGFGVPGHAAARGGGPGAGSGVRPRSRERGQRPRRQPRRHPLGGPRRRRSCWRSTSRPSRARARSLWGSPRSPLPPGWPSYPSAAGQRTRCTTSRWRPAQDLLGGRLAGIIVFGSLMGAMFIGQQFLQNVLGYSTLDAGLAILPAAASWCWSPRGRPSSSMPAGARFTLLIGYVFCLLGFLMMLLLWKEGAAYWEVGLGYAFVGAGVGFAGTPASHSLTGSVPVSPGRAWRRAPRISSATWEAPSCSRSSVRSLPPVTPPR